MKNPFQIGDRVRATGHIHSGANVRVVGLTGTIICKDGDRGDRFGVEFDTNFGGHSCNYRTQYGRGQWMDYRELEFEGKIVELTGDIESLF